MNVFNKTLCFFILCLAFSALLLARTKLSILTFFTHAGHQKMAKNVYFAVFATYLKTIKCQ